MMKILISTKILAGIEKKSSFSFRLGYIKNISLNVTGSWLMQPKLRDCLGEYFNRFFDATYNH